MDLYRTLWETSFDPKRGHDRTVNEFYDFRRLVTQGRLGGYAERRHDLLPAFLDLRKGVWLRQLKWVCARRAPRIESHSEVL
jgi:hypothetical protein